MNETLTEFYDLLHKLERADEEYWESHYRDVSGVEWEKKYNTRAKAYNNLTHFAVEHLGGE